MNSHVDLQVIISGKAFAADLTNIRFFSCVYSPMFDKYAGVEKCGRAILAFLSAIAVVLVDMSLQGVSGLVDSGAAVTLVPADVFVRI